MRLINVDSLNLEEFISNSLPKYAILSHTWGDGEVTFQDMQLLDSAIRLKDGFDKIQQSCEQAKKHNLQYVWVDTCCIDKTSSAELSEAINSMFMWYEAAEVCFVHLHDFQLTTTESFSISMDKCRWFTRGWCLQELLAPRNLELYDNVWTFIGTKISLSLQISIASGIDAAVLRNEISIWSVPVGRRMSWAARRQTTRPEDIAYCLLGIFQVNMPLLYGEGPKAFLRLQEEIMKESNDVTLFAWKSKSELVEHRGLLAYLPEEFDVRGHSSTVPLALLQNPVFGEEFASTNKGVFFKDTLLWYDITLGIYVLPIQTTESGIHGIFLEKFGPKMFVRVEPGQLASVAKTRLYRDLPKGIYVLKDVTPELERAVKKPASVQFRFKLPLVAEVQPGISSEFWDPAKQHFTVIDLDSIGSIVIKFRVDGSNEEHVVLYRSSVGDDEDDLVASIAVLILPAAMWSVWEDRIREPPLEYDPTWDLFCRQFGIDLDALFFSKSLSVSLDDRIMCTISSQTPVGTETQHVKNKRVVELELRPVKSWRDRKGMWRKRLLGF